jgi:hypothetical protein
VYIGTKKEVQGLFKYLEKHYPWITFYIGMDVQASGNLGWSFKIESDAQIVRDFRAVIESGIYNELKNFHTVNSMKARKNFTTQIVKEKFGNLSTNVKKGIHAFKLDSNVQTIFIIWVAFICIDSLSFILEKFVFFITNRGSN